MASKLRSVVLTAVVVLALAMPAAAQARPYEGTHNPVFIGRTLYGIDASSDNFDFPGVSGDFVVFAAQRNEPDAPVVLRLWNLATASETATWYVDLASSVQGPRISGDWVTWFQGGQVKAKSIKTGALVTVPAVAGVIDSWPTISGNYIVWQADQTGIDWDVKGWNLATNAPFSVANSDDIDEYAATVAGKRVSYLDDADGRRNLRVATIGSAAAPSLLSTAAWTPTIGDHIAAWCEYNADGYRALFYHDFDTGGTYGGPSNALADVEGIRVSGDRIVYTMSNGLSNDVWVFDTLLARAQGVDNASFAVADIGDVDERLADISGNQVVYLRDGRPMWGTLVTPSISLSAVPKRIPRLGHIHLKGSISEMGHGLGGVPIRIEKYTSGRWTAIRTLTTTASGAFSYQTPHNHSKTSYRVVYAGNRDYFGAGVRSHLSAVSSVKVAWPR